MSNTHKLGSLFDGSGGFPLAGSLCWITPAWASEVEPYPIAVTRSRFPGMKHLGDISKINGAEIEPVNIITFGSPCQDLSVAGKRAGLKHEVNGDEETTRSGLFMEAVRIIKEMRRATNGVYPRFALWENVPGAFSSNKGEDFRIVLQELIKIVEPAAFMPPVPKNGWAYADSYVGDGWSLAYRVFDAQYWGVPQRRRRIHLVIDFAGGCAGNVLFEREGLRGYFAEGRASRQGTAADAQGSPRADDCEGEIGGVAFGFDMYNQQTTGVVSRTLKTPVCGDDLPVVCVGTWDARGNGDGKTANTLTGDHNNRVTDYTSVIVSRTYQNTGRGWWNESPVGATVRTPCGGDSTLANIAAEMVGTRWIVRRMTPTECARLQGFADFWGVPDQKDDFTDEEYRFWLEVRNTHAAINGKAVKEYTKEQMLKWYNKLPTDSAEYKMWGNGIALPPALYCMQGIVDALEDERK